MVDYLLTKTIISKLPELALTLEKKTGEIYIRKKQKNIYRLNNLFH